MTVKLTDDERQTLRAWEGTSEENNVLPFSTISEWSMVPRHKIRRLVRSLARKGMLEIATGFSDDGMIMGRGYMPRKAGYEILKATETAE